VLLLFCMMHAKYIVLADFYVSSTPIAVSLSGHFNFLHFSGACIVMYNHVAVCSKLDSICVQHTG